jgi:cytochrome c oxidase subunit 4
MSHDTHNEHILPLPLYLTIGSILLLLTAITVIVAQFNFGPYNLLVAMIIAAIKASLVALYFMHLKYDSKIYATIFVLSVLFLAVFVTLTMFDTLRRGDLDPEKSGPIQPNAAMYDTKSDSIGVDSLAVDTTEATPSEEPSH